MDILLLLRMAPSSIVTHVGVSGPNVLLAFQMIVVVQSPKAVLPRRVINYLKEAKQSIFDGTIKSFRTDNPNHSLKRAHPLPPSLENAVVILPHR